MTLVDGSGRPLASAKPKRRARREAWDDTKHGGTPLALPAVADADLSQPINVRLLREYVRTQVVLPVLERLTNTALGVTKYPTPVGNQGVVLALPAPAAVQVQAQRAILSLGIPNQLGLVDDDGNTLPGVIALPVLDHDPLAGVPEAERSETPLASPLPHEAGYHLPEGLELVEVEEGARDEHAHDDQPPEKPPATTGDPKALAILERRRRRKSPPPKPKRPPA